MLFNWVVELFLMSWAENINMGLIWPTEYKAKSLQSKNTAVFSSHLTHQTLINELIWSRIENNLLQRPVKSLK